MSDPQNIPAGLCRCGCGQRTTLVEETNRPQGRFKGAPNRFITGHNNRLENPGHISEDRGFETPCWIWQGSIHTTTGYGKLERNRHSLLAHRWTYEREVGPIPKGLTLDHLCRVRECVNPDHLEPVTMRENNLRGMSPMAMNARKTHCKRGHEFTPENTYLAPSGRRICRTCKLDWTRRNVLGWT